MSVHQNGPVFFGNQIGAQGHGAAALRAAIVPNLVGFRVLEMTSEIGCDAVMQLAVLSRILRLSQDLRRL